MSTSVVKIIEVSANSTVGFEDAVRGGLARVAESVKNIQGAWISEQKVVTSPDGVVTEWRVTMRVSFVVQ